MITEEEIDADIVKLHNSIAMCISSTRNYEKAITDKRDEQKELRRLVDDPGPYDVEALKRNVDRCDEHIKMFNDTIQREKTNIKRYEQIITALEKKKWQLGQTSLATSP